MSVQQCKMRSTVAAMSSSNGPDLAARWFDLSAEQLEAKCGRFKRGKHAGSLRGWIVYKQCTEGGWAFALHSVIRPGMIFAIFCSTYDDMCEWMNKPLAEFMASAQRVDTAYGYDRLAAAAQRQAEFAQQQAWRQQETQAQADSLYYDMLAMDLENGIPNSPERKAEIRKTANEHYGI